MQQRMALLAQYISMYISPNFMEVSIALPHNKSLGTINTAFCDSNDRLCAGLQAYGSFCGYFMNSFVTLCMYT